MTEPRSMVYTTFSFEAVKLFQISWNNPRERPGRYGIALGLRRHAATGRARRSYYARVDPQPGGVGIVFFPRAIELCEDEFRQPMKDISFHTWPGNREHDPLGIPGTEIQFRLTADDWEKHKEALTALARSVHEALQERNQGGSSSELDSDDDEDDEGE